MDIYRCVTYQYILDLLDIPIYRIFYRNFIEYIRIYKKYVKYMCFIYSWWILLSTIEKISYIYFVYMVVFGENRISNDIYGVHLCTLLCSPRTNISVLI